MNSGEKIGQKTVSDEVIEHIISGIKEGTFQPGEKLPSEKELAKEFGLSRASIREAIQKLSMLGILEVKHGKGSYITENPSLEPLKEIVSPLLISGGIGVLELLEARKTIEGGTASIAAEKANSEDIKELATILKSMEQARVAKDIEEYSSLDLKFHLTISKISNNTILHRMVKTIRDLIYEQQVEMNKYPEIISSAMKFHIKIFNAIKQANGEEAANHMERHLETVQKDYMDMKELLEI